MVTRILQKFRSFEIEKHVLVGTEKQDVTLVLTSTDGCRVKAVK